MKIRIYQIITDKDVKGIAFESLDMMQRIHGTSKVDAGIYGLVYEGESETDDLEEIYFRFNFVKQPRPEDYHGHSLSVSDVVSIQDPESGEWSYHFCDSIGFQQIEFETELAEGI